MRSSSARLLFFSRKRRQCIVYSIFDGSDFFNSVEFVYSPGSFTEQGLYSLAIFKRRYMTSTEQRLFYGCITVVTDFMTNAVVLTVYQDTVIFTARVYSPVPLGKLLKYSCSAISRSTSNLSRHTPCCLKYLYSLPSYVLIFSLRDAAPLPGSTWRMSRLSVGAVAGRSKAHSIIVIFSIPPSSTL